MPKSEWREQNNNIMSDWGWPRLRTFPPLCICVCPQLYEAVLLYDYWMCFICLLPTCFTSMFPCSTCSTYVSQKAHLSLFVRTITNLHHGLPSLYLALVVFSIFLWIILWYSKFFHVPLPYAMALYIDIDIYILNIHLYIYTFIYAFIYIYAFISMHIYIYI